MEDNMTEGKFDAKKPATKAAVSGTVTAGGFGLGATVVLAAKYLFKQDISLEAGLAIAGGITAGIAGLGRGVETAIKWWFKMKKLTSELNAGTDA